MDGIVLWVVLGVIVLIVLFVIVLYNRLVALRQTVRQAWGDVDVQLKQRLDLIPNLVETVKAYASHERGTLEAVTAARAAAASANGPQEAAEADNLLTGALRQLFAVAEAYPDLKANQNFLELQQSLQAVEHDIQMARRYYNGAARDLNVMVESFPSNLVAGWFSFVKKAFFEIENEADRAVPKVSFPQ